MPPRNSLGVVSGVLKSPCASSHSTCTSGAWRTTAWNVVMQIEQSDDVRTGKRSGRQHVLDLAAGLEQAAVRVAQVVLEGSDARLAEGADQARVGVQRERQRLRPARPAGRAVRRPAAQRGDAQLPVHTGSRFSKNAFTPSWMSSGRERERQAARAGTRSRRLSAMSCWRCIASLPMRISSGDLAASLARPVGDRGVELLGRHDLVDDPDPLRLVRVDLLAQQQQLVGLLAPDVAVDQRHDHEREDPDVDLGRAEARALLGDDQVARQREPERAREHVAVGGADGRLAELADQVEQAREAVGGEVLRRSAAARRRSRRGRRPRRRPSRGWRSARRSGRRRRRARRSARRSGRPAADPRARCGPRAGSSPRWRHGRRRSS